MAIPIAWRDRSELVVLHMEVFVALVAYKQIFVELGLSTVLTNYICLLSFASFPFPIPFVSHGRVDGVFVERVII